MQQRFFLPGEPVSHCATSGSGRGRGASGRTGPWRGNGAVRVRRRSSTWAT